MSVGGNIFLIALGSNLGDGGRGPAGTICAALARVEFAGFPLKAISRFYRSPAFPAGSGPDYVNACAAIDAGMADPDRVLTVLHEIEAHFGRIRAKRWQARSLDLDLLGAGGLVLPDSSTHHLWRELSLEDQQKQAPEQLILPHPRLQDRAFVLIPLAEIAPAWRHPVLGQSVQEMLDALPDAEKRAPLPVSTPNDEDWALVKGPHCA